MLSVHIEEIISLVGYDGSVAVELEFTGSGILGARNSVLIRKLYREESVSADRDVVGIACDPEGTL